MQVFILELKISVNSKKNCIVKTRPHLELNSTAFYIKTTRYVDKLLVRSHLSDSDFFIY